MSLEEIKSGFDTPKELFAWTVTLAATGMLYAEKIDQWGWLAAVGVAATLLGWMKRVEVGQLKIEEKR